MRKPRIPRGKQPPALTRLKQLPAEDRQAIFDWGKELTHAECRKRIKADYGISLSSDSQLSKFRSWQLRQTVWDRFNEMVEQDEQAIQEAFPDMDRERLREMAIKRAYAMADLMGDPKLTLKVVQTDLKDSQDSRDWERLELLKRKAEQADQAKETLGSQLSEEEKLTRMKSIFGH